MKSKTKIQKFYITLAAVFFLAVPVLVQAMAHPAGSMVISGGTVYRVAENGQALEGFDSPEKYFSHRNSFASIVPANTWDLTLTKSVIDWGEGKLFNEQGTIYQVSDKQKHGFISESAFLGQGFKFSQAQSGTLNLPVGASIQFASDPHLPGTFIIDNSGTVWRLSSADRRGITSIDELRSWGLSFDEVVPANIADMNKPIAGLLGFRTGTLVNDTGTVWVVEGVTKRAFSSVACLTNFGFKLTNVLSGSTQAYNNIGTICGPAPSVNYERKTVATSRGNFTVDLITANLANGDMKIVTDTGNGSDCLNNCTVKSLASYVSDNSGVGGINGSYFCPASYAECAGKVNSFYWKVHNSRHGIMINANNGIKEDKPFLAFNETGEVRFFSQYKDLASSGFVPTAGISNEPLLIHNGQLVVTDNILDEKERTVKSNRGALGVSGQTVYAAVARSATVMDLAFVMQALGAEHAFNLDGGGSSALFYEGSYKLGPGRDIPNAWIFVRK